MDGPLEDRIKDSSRLWLGVSPLIAFSGSISLDTHESAIGLSFDFCDGVYIIFHICFMFGSSRMVWSFSKYVISEQMILYMSVNIFL